MIEGLKLTMTGTQLIEKLNERIADYEGIARYNERYRNGTECDSGKPAPEGFCESEVARSQRRIVTLTLIRDYIVPTEVYLLGEFDLRFADLLPEDDGWIDCGCPALRDTSYPETAEQVSDK